MTTSSPKNFNIAGPCIPGKHYMLPPMPRLPKVYDLVKNGEYFVLHAPRQSGKTTFIQAARDSINDSGLYYAISVDLQLLANITDNMEVIAKVEGCFNYSFYGSKIDAVNKLIHSSFWSELRSRSTYISNPIKMILRTLCNILDKGLVVFFDEIDGLTGSVLLNFLSQLRTGANARKNCPFPRCMALVGMRDIRDYKAKVRPESESIGSASPFNVIAASLTLANFSESQIHELYSQHTEATGQLFLDEAIRKAYYWSDGQPWLVNALAREVIDKILNNDHSTIITENHFDRAANNIMRRRDTHIDSLLLRLTEPAVNRILRKMKDGKIEFEEGSPITEKEVSLSNDIQYCRDIGIIKKEMSGPYYIVANQIYESIIRRRYSINIKKKLSNELRGQWMDEKTIDMSGLLMAFQHFWSKNSEKLGKNISYKEVWPHIALLGYLSKVVNGGAAVIDEYDVGLGYADIVLEYAGKNYVIELKIKENEKSRAKSIQQILGYMDRLFSTEGWLLVFDRTSKKSWGEKITWKTETLPTGQTIHVVGC